MTSKVWTIEDMEGIELTECRWRNFVNAACRIGELEDREERNARKISEDASKLCGLAETAVALNPICKSRKNSKLAGAALNPKRPQPQPLPPLPEEIKNTNFKMAGGKGISPKTTVIRKGLFETDWSKGCNRISTPMSRTSGSFSSEEEQECSFRMRDYGECSGTAADKSSEVMVKPKQLSNTSIPKRRAVDERPQPPPPLPEELKKPILEMAGGRSTSSETLVIKKGLCEMDLSEGHNRISIPMSNIGESFSGEEEKDGECFSKAAETSSAAMIKPKKLSNTSKSKRSAVHDGPQPPPPLPEEFKNAILEIARGKRNSLETLVIQKGLYETDLSKEHNRLSIPVKKISRSFLSEEEIQFLCRRDKGKKMNEKEVRIIEPSLSWGMVSLSRWDMDKGNGKKCCTYVIKGKWRYIVQRNGLSVRDVVQLWAFRIEDELCFALVKLPN